MVKKEERLTNEEEAEQMRTPMKRLRLDLQENDEKVGHFAGTAAQIFHMMGDVKEFDNCLLAI